MCVCVFPVIKPCLSGIGAKILNMYELLWSAMNFLMTRRLLESWLSAGSFVWLYWTCRENTDSKCGTWHYLFSENTEWLNFKLLKSYIGLFLCDQISLYASRFSSYFTFPVLLLLHLFLWKWHICFILLWLIIVGKEMSQLRGQAGGSLRFYSWDQPTEMQFLNLRKVWK